MNRVIVAALVTGCTTTTNIGLLQRHPADPVGASIGGSMGVGLVPREIVTLNVDVRGDIATHDETSGSRFTVGASALGGIPLGPITALARVGFWHSAFTNVDDRSVVPSFELAGYMPMNNWSDPKHPEHGAGSSGLVIGLREDLDHTAYTTLFVGIALFFLPGY